MGLCNSCWRWFTGEKDSSSETEPLLSEDGENTRTWLESAADIAAALKVGKLPSQAQIDNCARRILKSDALTFPLKQRGQLSPQAMKLVLDTRNFLEMILIFGLEKNPDDKLQDFFYQIWQLDDTRIYTHSDLNVSEIVETLNAAPSAAEVENDIVTLIGCFRSLASLLWTSVAFRAMLSSLAVILRQGIATLAENVHNIAQTVEVAAAGVENVANVVEKASEEIHNAAQVNSVEEAVSPVDIDGMKATTQDVIKDAVSELDDLHGIQDQSKPPNGGSNDLVTADVVATQIRDILLEARQDPRCISSIQTILNIAKKYVRRLETSTNTVEAAVANSAKASSVDIQMSPEVESVLSDAKILLERFTGGTQSLDQLVSTLQQIIFEPRSTESSSTLSTFLGRMQTVIYKTTADVDYVTSDAGKEDLLALVEEGKALHESGIPASFDPRVKDLFRQVSNVLSALESDRTTNRFVTSATTLSEDVVRYVSSIYVAELESRTKRSIGNFTETFWNDVRVYFIPKLLNGIVKLLWRSDQGMPLPLPRVEYLDLSVEAVLDPRFTLVSSSVRRKDDGCCSCFSSNDEDTQTEEDPSWSDWALPSSVRVQRWSEIKLDMGTNSTTSAVETSNTVQVHIDNIFSIPTLQERKIVLRGMLYYLNYKSFPAYEDQGTLDLDFDFDFGGEGASLDVDIQIDTSTEGTPQTPFRVHAVHLHLPDTIHLRPTLRQTKHWILNGMVVSPIVLPLVKTTLKRQVGSMLETWIRDGLQSFGDLFRHVASEAEQRRLNKENKGEKGATSLTDWFLAFLDILSPQSSSQEGNTELMLSVGGIQVHNHPPEPDEDDEEETVIAVGIVPQLFADKALPAPDSSHQIAAEVTQAVENVAENVEEAVHTGADAAATARTEMTVAHERYHARRVEEFYRDGWRSPVFG